MQHQISQDNEDLEMETKENAEIRFKLIGKYKFKSIFVRNLLLLILYSLVFLAVIFLYSNYMVRRNVAQRLELRTQAILEKTQESVDRELKNLEGQILQLSRDEYIVADMTAPNIKNSDRNYNIVYQLQAVRNVCDLVDEAYLYVTTDETIFTSYGIADSASRYIENTEMGRLINIIKNSEVRAGDQRFITIGKNHYIVLFAPVFYDRILGVLVFKIDNWDLKRMVLNGNAGSTGTVWIYDESGEPLLPNYMEYPSGLGAKEVMNIPELKQHALTDGDTYYKVISNENGWQYLLENDADLFGKESVQLGGGFFVILAGLVAFCVMFSIYQADSTYRPIRHLIEISENAGEKVSEENVKNELELLEKNVSYTVKKNQELGFFLQSIRPVMVSDTFRNLLTGHEIAKEKLEDTFRALNSSFNTELNYTVLLISLTSEEKTFTLVECNMLLHRLEQEMRAVTSGTFACSFVYMTENRHMAVVLGTPKTLSVNKIREWKEMVDKRLKNVCMDYPVQLRMGASRCLVDIMELHKIFSELCKDMNYREYLRNDKDEAGTTVTEFDQELIQKSFAALRENVETGENENAVLQMSKVTQELLELRKSYEERREFLVLWWRTVMNEIVPIGIFEKQHLDVVRTELFSDLKDETVILKVLNRFVEEIAVQLKENSSKLKKRYVERARQYIEDHYSESDLSLSGSAEYLGISQSYLSTQFKKEMGINFLDYLNRHRIEKSRQLLQMTDMTVEEIGFRTGFSSAKNFIRVFKKYMEISPGAYREQQEKETFPQIEVEKEKVDQ